MTAKEKNPLPYIIAAACFIVLFILMKAQDVRTENSHLTNNINSPVKETVKDSVQKRKVANTQKN